MTPSILLSRWRGVLYLGLASLISVSAISYSSFDGSLNTVGGELTRNYLGNIGAIIADILVQVFGLGTVVIIAWLSYWGYYSITDRPIPRASIKLASFAMLLISVCCLTEWLRVFNLQLPILSNCFGAMINNLLGGSRYLWGIHVLSILGAVQLLSDKFLWQLWPTSEKLVQQPIKPVVKHVRSTVVSSAHEDQDIQQEMQIVPIRVNTAPIVKHVEIEEMDMIAVSDGEFTLPSINLLNKAIAQNIKPESLEQLNGHAKQLLKVLEEFGVKGQIVDIHQGPVVTLYEFEPAAGIKASRVIGLAEDIARSLSALSTRISVIPGRNVMGIELPNKHRAIFSIRELLSSSEYINNDMILPIILGKDLHGKTVIVDLAKLPHILAAGTTGSGKSVLINAIIMSLLYRYTPLECRFIMIDPKMLELSVYNHIPHLLTPVVTEPSKAMTALKWAVKEMENRYRLMSSLGVRNIIGYNARVGEALKKGQELDKRVQVGFDRASSQPVYETIKIKAEKLPLIVIIVDEMADLMIVAGKEIEAYIQRLAQMARAAGIHLIMATQRPSVDVITGVIKANFPSRISCKLISKIDSRTILGQMGAEQLLGMGDMLYTGNLAKITRIHAPFVDDQEVEKVAQFLRDQGSPEYVTAVTEIADEQSPMSSGSNAGGEDEALYRQAVEIVKRERKASTSYVQRCLRIGYNRAALMIERMEKEGIVSPPNHTNKREIIDSE